MELLLKNLFPSNNALSTPFERTLLNGGPLLIAFWGFHNATGNISQLILCLPISELFSLLFWDNSKKYVSDQIPQMPIQYKTFIKKDIFEERKQGQTYSNKKLNFSFTTLFKSNTMTDVLPKSACWWLFFAVMKSEYACHNFTSFFQIVLRYEATNLPEGFENPKIRIT